jgi:hypothetical protein
MKRIKQNSLFAILLLGGTVTSWSWLSRPLTISQVIEKQPAQVQDCLKTQVALPALAALAAIERIDFIAQATESNKEYYLYRFEQNKKDPRQVIVSSPVLVNSRTGKTCQIEYSRSTRDPVPFSSAVPQSVANQLRLEQLQKIAEKQGDKFNAPIRAALSANFLGKLAPEDIWALQKMGFEIPAKQPMEFQIPEIPKKP